MSDADEVLREALAELAKTYDWVGIAFVEQGELVLGPATGPEPEPDDILAVPIVYDGTAVAELRVAPSEVTPEQRESLERVAAELSPYSLVGWDTGGEAWSP